VPSVLLVNPVVVWLGKLSYSFYVLHMFLIIIISRYIAKPINTWVLIAAVIFAGAPVCYLTYRLIEIPCINLGLKVIKARKLSKVRS
jgi:peptidoglycan/LPS O-acetylase OafA/YrhL